MCILGEVAALVHIVHIAATLTATVVLLAILAPARSGARVQQLRAAAASGQLRTLAEQRAAAELRHDVAGSMRATPSVERTARLLTSAGCLVAASVHALVCPEHFREATRFGLFFLALSMVQLVLVVLVARGKYQRAVQCAVAVNASTMLLWFVTRIAPLPFGLSEPEPIGVPDVVATTAELVAAVAGGLLILRWRASAAPSSQRLSIVAR